MHWCRCTTFLLLALLGAGPAGAATPTTRPLGSLFDPARHMRVAEVRPGMKGYGLSVFMGDKIDRFDVEVISVLHNFNPKGDVVLIRFSGDNLEHTTAIAGMSGSPIYLYDDAGKPRMIGAFAYGWQLQKDPIAGVQPIEYMLELPGHEAPATQPAGATGLPEEPKSAREEAGPARWSLSDAVLMPGMTAAPARFPLASRASLAINPRWLSGGDAAAALRPLATPLAVAGMSPRVLAEMAPLFRAYGLDPVAGGGGGSTDADEPIRPGSVLGVPLVGGDVDMNAIGTCTEVVGQHVVAFGHPFNGEGRTALPFCGGSIQGIVASLSSSFKLGTVGRAKGTLTDDETFGIAGELGAVPATVPIDLRVHYTDGSDDAAYHFTVASHPKLTPLLVAAAMTSAVTGAKELPANHTVDYDLQITFANGRTIRVDDRAVNVTPNDLFFTVGTPIIGATDNPFARVMVSRMSGTVTVTPTERAGQILYASVPKSRLRAGQTVRAFVTYRPFRGSERVLPIALPLPRDLPDGTYQLTISDWQKYMEDERTAEPFKFTAENVDQVFEVLQDAANVRHDAVYVRLLRQPDGVAIGHAALPRLPSSRRQIMIGTGRSDVTQFVSSALKVVPTDLVMSGSADFQITIDRRAD